MIKDHRVYRPYKRKNSKRFISFLFKILIITFILYQLITRLLIASFVIKSSAMEPALSSGEHIFINSISYGISLPFSKPTTKKINSPQPHRGDIVLINTPSHEKKRFPFSFFDSILSFFMLNKHLADSQQMTYSVKRIIAIPGDTIRIEDFYAFIKTNDSQQFVSEQDLIAPKYKIQIPTDHLPANWNPDFSFGGNLSEMTLAADEYFVLGDNRLYSNDSRTWQKPITISYIIGKVWWRYYPFRKIGIPR